jgi:hypothetical protein
MTILRGLDLSNVTNCVLVAQCAEACVGHGHGAQMKAPWTDPSLRELVALAALAAFRCGLALVRGDLLFLIIFGAASAVTIIEAVRRSR